MRNLDFWPGFTYITSRRAALQSPGCSKAHRPSTALRPLVGPRAFGDMRYPFGFSSTAASPGQRQPPGQLLCSQLLSQLLREMRYGLYFQDCLLYTSDAADDLT